jgi:hypothetical protein
LWVAEENDDVRSFRYQPQPFFDFPQPGVLLFYSQEVTMENMEHTLDMVIEQLKALGIERKDGEPLTREDATKILGVMSTVFGEMSDIMQESFARLHNTFRRFTERAEELELVMKRPTGDIINEQLFGIQVKDQS